MAIDFAKLLDPAYQAELRAEREAEQAKREAHDKKLRHALDCCLDHYETLTSKEQSFVASVRGRLNVFGVSEAQEKWLLDIEHRINSVSSPASRSRSPTF